jgi:NAD-dependent DNA ligase
MHENEEVVPVKKNEEECPYCGTKAVPEEKGSDVLMCPNKDCPVAQLGWTTQR